MELWWSRPDRLRWEIEELTRLGIRYDPPSDLESPGTFTLRVYMSVHGHEVPLDVFFPQLYPYFRCEVRASELNLRYHQHPFEKILCLLGRATHHWKPGYSLAWLLKEQLPKLEAALHATSTASADHLEEHQAEPVSDYYPYKIGDVVLVDSSWSIPPEFERGRVKLSYATPNQEDEPFRGVICEITWPDGSPLLRAPEHLLGLFPDTITGELLRLDAPLLIGEADEFQRRLSRNEKWHGHSSSQRSVLGVLFPEESSWRGSEGISQGWLFVVGSKPRRALRGNYRFVRVNRASVEDLVARAPELRSLREHKVAVVGLGCLGAPSALELARAGVGELRLLDRDHVDVAASLRWPFGLTAAGLPKTSVLGEFIRQHYPLTKTVKVLHALGGLGDDLKALHAALDGATMIYDAAAELGISHLLADWARHAGVPYVAVSSVQGAWGGQVARLLPAGRTGCWYCLERAKTGGVIPAPPYDATPFFQPTGCADPTFTGAGFDLSSIALIGVRASVATMLDNQRGYPALRDDVLVISLRDKQGALTLPGVRGFRLPPFPDCPACGLKADFG